jgi:hypothetical protein
MVLETRFIEVQIRIRLNNRNVILNQGRGKIQINNIHYHIVFRQVKSYFRQTRNVYGIMGERPVFDLTYPHPFFTLLSKSTASEERLLGLNNLKNEGNQTRIH